MTSSAASSLILHHYDESPYAEKIRSLLGYKGLAWQSVITPKRLPKPDLTALTGGYRKAPVLQIGADVYCDTRLIVLVLEQLQPTPSVAPQPGCWSEVIAHWVDVNLFSHAVAYTFSQIVDLLDDAFLADRAALSGSPQVMDRTLVKQSGPLAQQTLAAEMVWVETALQGPQPYINGPHPGHGDFALYCPLWFARLGRFDFTPYPATTAWMKRMKALGHGQRTELTAEAALDMALQAQPAAIDYDSVTPDPAGVQLGQRVSVQPDTMGKESVEGELVGINPQRISLKLSTERCGTVHVHFPRVGYRVRRCRN